jgi:hypothetical protein
MQEIEVAPYIKIEFIYEPLLNDFVQITEYVFTQIVQVKICTSSLQFDHLQKIVDGLPKKLQMIDITRVTYNWEAFSPDVNVILCQVVNLIKNQKINESAVNANNICGSTNTNQVVTMLESREFTRKVYSILQELNACENKPLIDMSTEKKRRKLINFVNNITCGKYSDDELTKICTELVKINTAQYTAN